MYKTLYIMGKTTNLNWLARFFLKHQQYHPSPITLHEEIPKNSGETATKMICWDSYSGIKIAETHYSPQVPLNKDASTSYKRNLLPSHRNFSKTPKRKQVTKFSPFGKPVVATLVSTIFTRRWTLSGASLKLASANRVFNSSQETRLEAQGVL